MRRAVQSLVDLRYPKIVVLDIELTNELDVETVDVLEQLRSDLAFGGIEFWLACVHSALGPMLERSGLGKAIGAERMFLTTRAASAALMRDSCFLIRRRNPPIA